MNKMLLLFCAAIVSVICQAGDLSRNVEIWPKESDSCCAPNYLDFFQHDHNRINQYPQHSMCIGRTNTLQAQKFLHDMKSRCDMLSRPIRSSIPNPQDEIFLQQTDEALYVSQSGDMWGNDISANALPLPLFLYGLESSNDVMSPLPSVYNIAECVVSELRVADESCDIVGSNQIDDHQSLNDHKLEQLELSSVCSLSQQQPEDMDNRSIQLIIDTSKNVVEQRQAAENSMCVFVNTSDHAVEEACETTTCAEDVVSDDLKSTDISGSILVGSVSPISQEMSEHVSRKKSRQGRYMVRKPNREETNVRQQLADIQEELMIAVQKDDIGRVKDLLDQEKAILSMRSVRRSAASGKTALMCAAENGHLEIVRLLLSRDGGKQDQDGRTALMYAAKNGHYACVVDLLCKESGKSTSVEKYTALMYAVEGVHEACVDALRVECGKKNKDGYTALMLAVHHRRVECIKYLHADLGITVFGKTALMFAAECGYEDCVRLLADTKEAGMQRKDGYTALMLAVSNNHAGCVDILCEQKAEVSKRNASGLNALILAAVENHHQGITQALVHAERGMRDCCGRTALMCAAFDGNHLCVKNLLDEACLVNAEGILIQGVPSTHVSYLCYKTALVCAAVQGHTECVKLLMDAEAGMQDEQGRTALIFAAINHHLECAKLLMPREGHLCSAKDLEAICRIGTDAMRALFLEQCE